MLGARSLSSSSFSFTLRAVFEARRLEGRDSFAIIQAGVSKHEGYNFHNLSSPSGLYVPFRLPFLTPLCGSGFLSVAVAIPPLL